jgi:hypothetical protein
MYFVKTNNLSGTKLQENIQLSGFIHIFARSIDIKIIGYVI